MLQNPRKVKRKKTTIHQPRRKKTCLEIKIKVMLKRMLRNLSMEGKRRRRSKAIKELSKRQLCGQKKHNRKRIVDYRERSGNREIAKLQRPWTILRKLRFRVNLHRKVNLTMQTRKKIITMMTT